MQKCILCKKKFVGFGNNPEPLAKSGKCCDKCNVKVIVARIKFIKCLGQANIKALNLKK